MKNFRVYPIKTFTNEIFLDMLEEIHQRKGVMKLKRKALNMMIILSINSLSKLEDCILMIRVLDNSHFAHHKLIIQINEIKRGNMYNSKETNCSSPNILNLMTKILPHQL